MYDVSGLVPEARQAALATARVYWQHTYPWFIGLVCFGSAVRGDFIPGVSDIDFHLYLRESAFTLEGTLPLQLCLGIHKELAEVDPAPFRYIDGGAEMPFVPPGHVGPIPGAYHVVVGELPVAEATSEQLKEQARWALARLTPVPAFVTHALLKHGEGRGRLASTIRLFCQIVWPVLYQVLSLRLEDAIRAWQSTKQQAIDLLPPDALMGQEIRRFHQAMQAYYPSETSTAHALKVVEHGIAFLQAAKAWSEQVCSAAA